MESKLWIGERRILSQYKPIEGTYWCKPEDNKISVPICHMGDYTGCRGYDGSEMFYPADLTHNIHKGITIGNGKTLYWMMIWHKSGNVTVYNKKEGAKYGRYLSGDQLVTIHWI